MNETNDEENVMHLLAFCWIIGITMVMFLLGV
jgi:hypothetical protein